MRRACVRVQRERGCVSYFREGALSSSSRSITNTMRSAIPARLLCALHGPRAPMVVCPHCINAAWPSPAGWVAPPHHWISRVGSPCTLENVLSLALALALALSNPQPRESERARAGATEGGEGKALVKQLRPPYLAVPRY